LIKCEPFLKINQRKKIKTFEEFFGGKTEKVQHFDHNKEIHKTNEEIQS
jgi:hypothetical protein